jgi:hypothetical protein
MEATPKRRRHLLAGSKAKAIVADSSGPRLLRAEA